jgi:hypothetical protein
MHPPVGMRWKALCGSLLIASCAAHGTQDGLGSCRGGRSLVVEIDRAVDESDAEDLAEMRQQIKDFFRDGPVQPTTEQAGCFEVNDGRALPAVDAVPRRLELRLQGSSCAHVRNALDAIPLDSVVRSGRIHGHWWRPDEGHVGVVWGNDFSGVLLLLEPRDDGYAGLAAVIQDVHRAKPERTVIALRRVACPP